MISSIVALLLESRGLNEKTDQAAYLKSLRPKARRLWNAYRKPNIQVDYSDGDYQAVYMIRYFAFYSQLIRGILTRALEAGKVLPFDREKLAISLFCSGAVP